MSFSKYSIEKKQVSTDRGVTWQDVTPAETRQGTLVDVYKTLLECEDTDCDLEKTEYTVIDAPLPNEICGDMISVLPSGIASSVTWTNGAICCAEWQTASPYGIDRNNVRHDYSIGKPYCIHDFNTTYCPSFNYSSSIIVGSEITNLCFEVHQYKDYICPETLCACFTIDVFMPWCAEKTTWKLIQAQHYSREHCSEEWQEDGEPYICGIAERWKYVDETFERERWIHQIAKTFDDNGNVVEWQSEGNLVYRPMTDTVLDHNIDILDYVINDGVICWAGTTSSSLFPTEMYIQIATNESYNFSGKTVHYKGYTDGTDSFSVLTNSAGTPYISGIHLWGAGYNWDDAAVTLTDKLSPYRIYSARADRVCFRGIFCDMIISYDQKSRMYYISSVNNILSGTKTGKIVDTYGNTIAFPCRIHENLGQSDDYWNSSQIGYVFRNGDGSMITMETLSLEGGQLVKEHPNWTSYH